MKSDHLNSIAGTTMRHAGMKLSLHHPYTGLLRNIGLLRTNYLVYFERKNLLSGFSHAPSEMAFSSWHGSSVGGKNEKNCTDFTRTHSVACKLDSVTHSNTALSFKGLSCCPFFQ